MLNIPIKSYLGPYDNGQMRNVKQRKSRFPIISAAAISFLSCSALTGLTSTSILADPTALPIVYSQIESLPENTPPFAIVIEEQGQETEVAQNQYLCNPGFAFDPTIGSCSFSIQVNPVETRVAEIDSIREVDEMLENITIANPKAQTAANSEQLRKNLDDMVRE